MTDPTEQVEADPPQRSIALLIGVAEAICRAEHPDIDDEIVDLLVTRVPKYKAFAQAAIKALNPPPREFVDDEGWTWGWCGGEPGTWAWRRIRRPS